MRACGVSGRARARAAAPSRSSAPPRRQRHEHQPAARACRWAASAGQRPSRFADPGVAQRQQVLGGEIARGRRAAARRSAAGSREVGSSTASRPAGAARPAARSASSSAPGARRSRRPRTSRPPRKRSRTGGNITLGPRLDGLAPGGPGLARVERLAERVGARQARERDLDDPGAGARRGGRARASKAAAGRLAARPAPSSVEHAEVDARRARRPRGRRAGRRRAPRRQGRVLDRAGERARRVEGRGERHHAVERQQAVGGLEPDEVVPGGGQADRAAGVRADGGGGEAEGDRGRGPEEEPPGRQRRGR